MYSPRQGKDNGMHTDLDGDDLHKGHGGCDVISDQFDYSHRTPSTNGIHTYYKDSLQPNSTDVSISESEANITNNTESLPSSVDHNDNAIDGTINRRSDPLRAHELAYLSSRLQRDSLQNIGGRPSEAPNRPTSSAGQTRYGQFSSFRMWKVKSLQKTKGALSTLMLPASAQRRRPGPAMTICVGLVLVLLLILVLTVPFMWRNLTQKNSHGGNRS